MFVRAHRFVEAYGGRWAIYSAKQRGTQVPMPALKLEPRMQIVPYARFAVLVRALGLVPMSLAATDASLVINIHSHLPTFQQGEVVPLDLAFTSEKPQRFSINMATYDRSGRMGYERFVVEPTPGIADPLDIYFKASRAFMGGGLTNFQYLSEKPFVLKLELNEWVRFDQPGVYRVAVISQRVSDHNDSGHEERPVELRSNELTLEIVPADPAWQKTELTRVQTVLKEHPSAGPMRPDASRTMALKSLRYLGTTDAAREMARLFQSEDNQAEFECMFGLVGSPNRAAGLDEMRRLLIDPDFPVRQNFLSTMSLLSLGPNTSREALATQRDENFKQLRKQLIETLPSKKGLALAFSADSVLSGDKVAIPAELRDKVARQLISSFDSLPIEVRSRWLEERWDDVKGAQWIPLLRRITDQYTDFPVPNEMQAYRSLKLSAAALTHWYELDPTEARSAVVNEIERPKPRFGREILGLLPDKTLPEAEHTIALRFVGTTDYNVEANLAGLLHRYGDRDALPAVFPKIDEFVGTWACAPQTNALAYVLKVDQDAARPLLARALSSRARTGCWHSLLTDVGAMQPSPVLDEFAKAALYDPDAELATDAARYLGQHGAAGAEQDLWARYLDWSKRWKSREGELRFGPVGPQTHVWDANLGQALARALAGGQAWFADEARLRQIGALATDSIAQELDANIREASERPVKIQYIGFTPPQFRVAQYQVHSTDELKKKLVQFPRTISFAFIGLVPQKDPQVVRDLKKWAEEMKLEISGLESTAEPR